MKLTDLYKKTSKADADKAKHSASAEKNATAMCAETKSEATDDVKAIGKLDMVIAFDTTGSMAAYIDAVRQEVAELVPRLFEDNDDMRLGIVAFGDYCDMDDASHFGRAYQSIGLTNDQARLVDFVRNSKDTSGGDGDEFYELVIRKIVEETLWREGSTRVMLLIADSKPHDVGYSFGHIVSCNRVDWREEARKAADKGIKIDTVTITDEPWFKELSRMTNGVSSPFESGSKTARLVEAAALSRGSVAQRRRWDSMRSDYIEDEELDDVFSSYYEDRCCGDDTKVYDEEEAMPWHRRKRRVTPDKIERLSRNEIFVFGSNVLGMHRGGAARFARKKFGAKMGHPRGLQGQSYAIPTVGLPESDIEREVQRFCEFAEMHPELTFFVTPVGCGIAGFVPEDIAPMFRPATELSNVLLPESFWDVLK